MRVTVLCDSGCDCVRKSRLRSNPFPFARVPAIRPSGFWIGLKTMIDWSRIWSTSGSVPYGVSGQPLDHLHRGVDALVFISVDAALDEQRHLHVVTDPVENVLRALRILERVAADLLPVRVVAALRLCVELVDDDVELVATESGLTETLDGHAAAAGCRDVVERASDRVVRDVREASVRVSRKRLASVRKARGSVRLGVPHHGGAMAVAAVPAVSRPRTKRQRAAPRTL